MKRSEEIINKFEWLIDYYETRDPAEIAYCLKINVSRKCLGNNLSGLYIFDSKVKNKWILLNFGLTPIMERFVLCHELGHAFLHPEISSVYIEKDTLISKDPSCIEANQFAAFLLIEDKKLIECIHRHEDENNIALKLKVPVELIRMKMGLMEKNFAG